MVKILLSLGHYLFNFMLLVAFHTLAVATFIALFQQENMFTTVLLIGLLLLMGIIMLIVCATIRVSGLTERVLEKEK